MSDKQDDQNSQSADSPGLSETQPNRLLKFAKEWLPYAAILAIVYFGNIEVQSYLGRQAVEEAGLAEIPLAQALAQAEDSNKLVLADMSAIWCSSCRKLDKQVLSDAEVKQAIDEKYVFTRIEYESAEGKAFAERYQVSGFPTLLVLDAEGNKLRNLGLTFDADEFISRL